MKHENKYSESLIPWIGVIVNQDHRQLFDDNQQLQSTLEEQRHQIQEQLIRQKEEMSSSSTHHHHHHHRNHDTLQQQLRHSQDQVRMLKATMEQFLRMGIFSEDVTVYKDIAARYSTTLKARYVYHRMYMCHYTLHSS